MPGGVHCGRWRLGPSLNERSARDARERTDLGEVQGASHSSQEPNENFWLHLSCHPAFIESS